MSLDVADFASYSTSNNAVPIAMAAKAPAEGETYLFAAAARNGTTTVTFTLAGDPSLSCPSVPLSLFVCVRACVCACVCVCDGGALRADTGGKTATVAQPIGEEAEDRANITIANGKFRDDFSSFGVHLYRLY
eukprot:COSAG03_NODE_2317_length_2889_cov_26.777419_5_plen_133_part_00